MKKLDDLPDSPLNQLVAVQSVDDTDATVLDTIQKVEQALGSEKWYGNLPYVFSRNNKDDSPDNQHWLQNGMTTRLLDKPSITSDLIQRTILHVEGELRRVLGTFGGLKRARPHLEHNINACKHRQKATLLSYLIRAFCPDNTQAIIPEDSIYLTEEDTAKIIQSLPLDPDKLNDETLQKIGLAPDDFETYTLQARRRYKLWIRERFFQMMSEAEVLSFDIGPRKQKSTARILRFHDAKNEEMIWAFINTSGLHIHMTPAQRKSRHKVMDTYFRVFESEMAFMKSQSHALEEIVKKGDVIGIMQDLFKNYSTLSSEEQEELLTDTLAYFSQKNGFHEKKLTEFIQRVSGQRRMVGNVVRALYDLDYDLTGKYHELREALRLFRLMRKTQKK